VGIVVAPQRWSYLRRPVLVITDLAYLHGPTSGILELPLWLYWSGEHGRFDLDNPAALPVVYRTVLREARAPSDLTDYLGANLLVGLWPRLVLPKTVRAAWEDQHPAIRAVDTTSPTSAMET
jgi:hypothetical protein